MELHLSWTYLSIYNFLVNTVPADVLALQSARPSADTVFNR